MKRIALTNGSGQWFDAEKAEEYREDTWWNGSNHISKATNSQWEHEWLYRTASGRWVLNRFSNYQNSPETYEEIDASEAARWLSFHGHNHPELAANIAEMEV